MTMMVFIAVLRKDSWNAHHCENWKDGWQVWMLQPKAHTIQIRSAHLAQMKFHEVCLSSHVKCSIWFCNFTFVCWKFVSGLNIIGDSWAFTVSVLSHTGVIAYGAFYWGQAYACHYLLYDLMADRHQILWLSHRRSYASTTLWVHCENWKQTVRTDRGRHIKHFIYHASSVIASL